LALAKVRQVLTDTPEVTQILGPWDANVRRTKSQS
jgi:hypothetical protein